MKKLLTILLLSYTCAYSQDLQTNISVHDPVMYRQDSVYYIFCTGNGISMWSSTDMLHWKHEKPVFDATPQWAVEAIPGLKRSMWAPDISYNNGLYYLYYSVSAFGKNTSAIGVATNKTLHTDDSAYHWTDRGAVIKSVPGKTNWNAIDPNIIVDNDGTPYMVFGSFWEGIKIVKLHKDRFTIAGNIDKLPTIASRKSKDIAMPSATGDKPANAGANAIEGAFVFKKGRYYYLFASIDYCCKGPESTYKMIVGRAERPTGPYLDKNNVPMAAGGGCIVLAGDKNWYGVGHNAVCTFNGVDYLIFHGYDAADKGRPKLRIEPLNWDGSGWPAVAGH